MPGLASAELTWSLDRLPINADLKRPAPGFFRTGTWTYGGEAVTPPIEQTHAMPLRLASSRHAIAHDGAYRYENLIYRGVRTPPVITLNMAVIT